MSRPTIAILKFVGSITLGLSTGASVTLAAIASPALLALPSAAYANQAFENLITSSKFAFRALEAVSAGSLALAYWISPRRIAHPYLIWAALTVGLSSLPGKYIFGRRRKIEKSSRRVNAENRDLNGEEVRKSVETYQQSMAIQGAILGFGFAMSVIGIWGDGY